ncbi:YoaP domain-containing protein [uncultured Clostridium sp.]|uniref:YoaP domain-containing protein n=1 Tax=uncultured Clostridium sp. TaxID=59620 RepID=UPI0025F0D3D3|nr:YoaP domain-containing protein [uncultured Clostridium sp.]
MEYIRITKENLQSEHICCAISNKKDAQVLSKKNWINDRLEDGLVFLKGNERGKCFIEYIPAENAWIPIEADGYMYIDCFWVAGAFKGHGYSNDLLNECIKDSKVKGKAGLCILSSAKKKPYLSDPKYLAYKGFKVADQSEVGINLMYLPFDQNNQLPRFKDWAKNPQINEKGYVLYYTSQCPFNAKYVPLIEQVAEEYNIQFKAIHIGTKEEAQQVPSPCTSYVLFYDGKFVTNEILSDKKFLKMIKE